MITRKLSPPEECFSIDYNLGEAYKYFLTKNGYPATEHRIALGLLRLGPVVSIHSASSASLKSGSIVLLDGHWVTVEDIDGNTVLDTSGNLLDLPDSVKVRS